VNHKVSKITDTKRGDLDKAYWCITNKDVECDPDILRRREALTVRGGSVIKTLSPGQSPKRTRRSKDSGSLSCKVSTYDEFKRKKNRARDASDTKPAPTTSPTPTNLEQAQYGSVPYLPQCPTQPLHPPPPLPDMVTSPLQYVRLVMHPGCPVPTPSALRVDVNAQIDRQLPVGASCFNDHVRGQLEAAK
jgi:hypothetical protein